jgi:hypothetical protein
MELDDVVVLLDQIVLSQAQAVNVFSTSKVALDFGIDNMRKLAYCGTLLDQEAITKYLIGSAPVAQPASQPVSQSSSCSSSSSNNNILVVCKVVEIRNGIHWN